MSIPIGARVDLWAPILKIAGFGDIRCLTKDGGAADSEELRIRPGGGLAEVSLGGRRRIENVTVTISLSAVGPSVHRGLRARTGTAVAAVYEVPLDANLQAFGAEQLVCSGTLKKVGGIKSDANGNDQATFEVEVTAVADSAGGS